VTNEKTHTKKIIFHPKMLPVQTICDPGADRRHAAVITAATGMDAFSHGLEALACRPITPSATASRRMRAAGEENLVTAYRMEQHEARAHMMAAAAAGAPRSRRGWARSTRSRIGRLVYNTHHGLTNAVFIPYVLRSTQTRHKIKRLRA